MTAAAFTVAQISVVAAVICFSAMVTAVAGFGFGLMSVPLMSLSIDLHSSVIVSSIVAVLANGVQVTLFRRSLVWPLALRLTAAATLGLPFGYAVYVLVDDRPLRFALGAGVVVAVAMLARGVNLEHVGTGMDWSLGFVSGVLNTSISTSGPPLVFDLQSRRLPADAFRATINFVFLVSGVIGLVIFAVYGKVHGRELVAGAVAVPALGLGMLAGLPLRKRFSPERFRVLVMVLLIAGAVAAVAKAFT